MTLYLRSSSFLIGIGKYAGKESSDFYGVQGKILNKQTKKNNKHTYYTYVYVMKKGGISDDLFSSSKFFHAMLKLMATFGFSVFCFLL